MAFKLRCPRCGRVDSMARDVKLVCSCGAVLGDADDVERVWEEAGRTCLARFVGSPLGHRCGYVLVEPGGPLDGLSREDPLLHFLNVHGGITKSVPAETEFPLERGVHAWAVGFDCMHVGDAPDVETAERLGFDCSGELPGWYAEGRMWTLHDVVRETSCLARQVASLELRLRAEGGGM